MADDIDLGKAYVSILVKDGNSQANNVDKQWLHKAYASIIVRDNNALSTNFDKQWLHKAYASIIVRDNNSGGDASFVGKMYGLAFYREFTETIIPPITVIY